MLENIGSFSPAHQDYTKCPVCGIWVASCDGADCDNPSCQKWICHDCGIELNGKRLCPDCAEEEEREKGMECQACNGDGIERCTNSDHGFIRAMSGDISRLGCPCCGHDDEHRITGSPCPNCNGTGIVVHDTTLLSKKLKEAQQVYRFCDRYEEEREKA